MKNALITGATKGMGQQIALALAKEGLNLAICSRQSQELNDFKDKLTSLRPDIKVFAIKADCSIKQEVQQFAQQAEKALGFIDVIVNNVGMFQPSSILDDNEDAFDININTNLRPAYELYRYFGKKMIAARKGHIFNICSVAAIDPVIAAGTYTVTKAALRSLSSIMRLETQQHQVKVTTVIPGSTLTSSWGDTPLDKSRFVLPEDVASAIINIYRMSTGANVDEIVIKPVLGQV